MHLLLVDGSGFVFRAFHALPQLTRKTDGLPSDFIWPLHIGQDDTLWIGTYDRGLAAYRDGRFSHIDMTGGIPGNMISQIIEDESGALWLGTNGGIARVDQTELARHGKGRISRVSARRAP